MEPVVRGHVDFSERHLTHSQVSSDTHAGEIKISQKTIARVRDHETVLSCDAVAFAVTDAKITKPTELCINSESDIAIRRQHIRKRETFANERGKVHSCPPQNRRRERRRSRSALARGVGSEWRGRTVGPLIIFIAFQRPPVQ